jgi:hypothetical protein
VGVRVLLVVGVLLVVVELLLGLGELLEATVEGVTVEDGVGVEITNE